MVVALLLRAWLAASAFWWAPSAGCPEPCACVDKYAQQFADCAYKDLQTVPSGLPSNVTTLSLSANKITALARGTFAEVTQVTSLWLAHNQIRAVEEGTLAVLGLLKNLDVSHNQISDFPWADLRNLSALQLLKMNNNRMAQLPSGAFSSLSDLRSLRINNNFFSGLAEGTFDPLTSLSHLQIYNNPFNCTCQLMWLKNWTEHTLISIPEREAITCAAPEAWKDKPLLDVPYMRCAAPVVRLSPQPELQSLAYGSSLALHCHADGIPRPELTWRIQASGRTLEIAGSEADRLNALPPSGAGERQNFRAFPNGTLLLPHLGKKEEGTYTCVAANEVGSNQSSLRVALADAAPKDKDSVGNAKTEAKAPPGERKASKNSVMKPEEKRKLLWPPNPNAARDPDTAGGGGGGTEAEPRESHPGADAPSRPAGFEPRCGGGGGLGDAAPIQLPRYVSNHAFNQSSELKPQTFDLGVIALDVSEREAKVQITPLSGGREKGQLRHLYLCQVSRGGAPATLVRWSQIEEGLNSYWFRGLAPGTNYSVCLSFAAGEDCQVQVVFSTKKEVPSLLIIVVVSAFLLALATLPLLGATCCHLLSKYQGKTYRLILRAQNPADQMEKHMAADFDPRASYLESEKNYQPSEVGRGELEEEEEDAGEEEEEEEEEERRAGEGGGQLARDPSLAAGSLAESHSKANPEEFEGGSEYSDRLPLGAEAVTIAQEINGNYKPPPR
ncbi:immunoglobulin superfamily containing leucine-rich repeat protein 2-like [Pseudonaja textilis]|uniref:immunoglobulin superfamily containing leucine-rich repeat protein 2-like n=1 Tax=Pseudonaja textilis TaxID=8673 RepID=UPI000EAA3D62|nr:immunoglobulin superfamily containing leucine-rich repeat protein 2-like [Pseudonaja textilis]